MNTNEQHDARQNTQNRNIVSTAKNIFGWKLLIPFIYFSFFHLVVSGMDGVAWKNFPLLMAIMEGGFFLFLFLCARKFFLYYNSKKSSATGDEDNENGGASFQ